MNFRALLAAAAGMAVLSAAAASRAQSIDYGSLEKLFGEPVTTSATGTPQRASEVPVDMTIITAEEIKRSGVTDIPTILSRVAGIDVLNFSGGDSEVGVRGYDQAYSPRLLVLIDGRQVYLDHYGYTSWNTLPVQLSEIRQIEVVRGPNSALFGFNAVGGVINIITYNPKYDRTNAVSAAGGNNGQYNLSAVSTAKLGEKAWMRFSAGMGGENEWKAGPQTVPILSSHNPVRYSTDLDGGVQLAPNVELDVEGSWSKSLQTDMAPTLYELNADVYQTWSARATINAETAFGLIKAETYVNNLDDAIAANVDLDFRNRVWVASVQDLFKIGPSNTFRLGFEYRDNQLDTTPVTGGTVSYQVAAPQAMWNWTATSKLSFTAALRLDALWLNRSGLFPPGFPNASNALWNRTIDVAGANAGIVYKATDADTLRLTYARGVQIPTLQEEGGFQLVAGGGPFAPSLGGNPFLKPSIVSNYQASYDRSLAQIGAKLSVKVFYQTTVDVKSGVETAVPPVVGSGLLLTYVNAGRSSMDGFELSASGKLAQGFRWSADYTYTKVMNDLPPGDNAGALYADFAHSTPKDRGNVNLGWTGGRWDLDGFVHYTSAFDEAYPEVHIDGFATLAGRIGYRLDHGLTLALSGQNLTTDRQTQSVGFQAPRQMLFSLSKAW
jgi:iron complex outermembrane receptor protein